MELEKYDIGSRNSAALNYLNRKYIQANTLLEKASIWHPVKYIKNLIEYNFWKKQWELGYEEIPNCSGNKIESNFFPIT